MSYPDISLLSPMAELLGVTAGELLKGERSTNSSKDIEGSIDSALHYAEKAVKTREESVQNIFSLLFSGLLVISILVCAICDVAISGRFTWSLFPISSIIFAWFLFFPVIRFGKRGTMLSMAALTVLIIPFLYVLSYLVGSIFMLHIGVRISVIAIVFLWGVYILFKILKNRKLLAGGISLLGVIPVHILINVTLFHLISEPIIDVWDIFTLFIIVIGASILFAMDWSAQRHYKKRNSIHDSKFPGE